MSRGVGRWGLLCGLPVRLCVELRRASRFFALIDRMPRLGRGFLLYGRKSTGHGLAILRRMESLAAEMRRGRWGLARARELARRVEGDGRAVKALVAAMFDDEPEMRKRALDVARRITERAAKPLERYADELAGLLAEMPLEESRTRWHLGLVVARVAHTREQRLRAARLMELLMEDESNVARCSAVEGIGLLAVQEASLREMAEEMIERVLLEGTLAMKCRAREAKWRLERATRARREG